MKKILGLDLGTNSIGWALIESDLPDARKGRILGAGSRIIPMSQDVLGKFDSGISISQTAERTGFRSTRRLRERHLLRRERLHRVLHLMGFLPEHYAQKIDFEKRLGQFLPETEVKLAYSFNNDNNRPEFLFKESFEEMLKDFAAHQPELVSGGKKIPYDWTIFYLRNKALTKKVGREELAWLLLHFNQKRGYYQLRGEGEEEVLVNRTVEFYSLLVTSVEAADKRGDEIWYNVHLENGWIYRRSSKVFLEWAGKRKDFIVTTELNDDGSVKKDREGKDRRSFRAPAENDWTLVKKKTEQDIDRVGKTVGSYIYDTLLQKPSQKIKGKLVRVIERRFYKAELEMILENQKKFHPELQNKELYNACMEELYPYNDAHRSTHAKKGFTHLFLNDIIFYQRPLKSKKSLIADCKYEKRIYLKDGQSHTEPLKGIPKSHPLFQEFRLWQFIQNLKIYQREKIVEGKLETDVNLTNELLPLEEDCVRLFIWLNSRKEITQEVLLKQFFKLKKPAEYRWNYVEDKAYPANETKAQLLTRLSKVPGLPANFLNDQVEEALWHILYSVEDKSDLRKALQSFAKKNQAGAAFVEAFQKFPPFDKEYGSLSAKAIKKLLPLMRPGSFWNPADIDAITNMRIEKIISGEWDEGIKDRVRSKTINLTDVSHFRGLPLWLATYVVYNRHSEDGDAGVWKKPEDIQLLTQHSLRNPIVEQVINETLKIVKDIWLYYGNGVENFFDEIHVELGREMKNPADVRREITGKALENENTNLRIKALLQELLNQGDVHNVRPHSPMQQEILKIYEEGALLSDENIPDDITKISRQAQPTQAELVRYKLWMEQKYRSPYTGQVIPLNRLFTRDYDIEHIIPQSRYFDNSLSNKVICEVEVNKDKDKEMAYSYIKANRGKMIELSNRPDSPLFTIEEYEHFVRTHYSRQRGKMKKLLMEDIPENFVQRQLNDTRYISKTIKRLLSNIVRKDGEEEAIATNVVASNGAITNSLKQDWGLNEIWNELITPRFQRLNEISGSNRFGVINPNTRKFLPEVPLELQRGFSKKRIDHRHHALDAIIIACASRNHVNYLNNENAVARGKNRDEKEKLRYDLKHKLCFKKYNDDTQQHYKRVFHKPWETFTQEVKEYLNDIVVSFKQNLRVLNRATNQYQVWQRDAKGEMVKVIEKQKGANWAIRKPLHKDTVGGLVNLRLKKHVSLSSAIENVDMIVDKKLRQYLLERMGEGLDKKKIITLLREEGDKANGKDLSKVEVYYWSDENVATRVKVDETFSAGIIHSVTDSGIRAIMLKHLSNFNEEKNGKVIEHPELAFSPDGLDAMNRDIIVLNGGKSHHPIYKVRTYEPLGNKFAVGQTAGKSKKFVEAAKGTNLFFAIYLNATGKRSFETVPLNVVVERRKQGEAPVPEKNEAGHPLLFSLSPNDLVYVPTKEEQESDVSGYALSSLNRIYKIVSFTGVRLSAVPVNVARSIVDKVEFTQLNKLEFTYDDRSSIKDHCIKLKIDRLGHGLSHDKPHNQSSALPVNIISEPGAVYRKNAIRTFASFDEMNEADARDLGGRSPEQHIQHATELISRIHAEELQKPMNKTIKFK